MSAHFRTTTRRAALLLLMLMSVGVAAFARPGTAPVPLGTVVFPVPVWADCKQLPEGAYDVQRTGGDSEGRGQYWVEFLQDGIVKGRELATVVTPEEATRMYRGVPRPDANSARVDLIVTNRYVRVWINHGRFDYVINLPEAPPCTAPLVISK
jgi:hypothetical protein